MTHASLESARQANRTGGTTNTAGPKCPVCGGPRGETLRNDKKYCSDACRAKYWRRAQVRGGQVYELLILWRKHRGKRVRYKGREVSPMVEIGHLVDGWLREDKGRIS